MRTVTAVLTALLFVFALAPVEANPAVPYCNVFNGNQVDVAAICETLTGRVFPEAHPQEVYLTADAAGHSNTGFATDYVGFFEFQNGLAYLESQYPDYIETHIVAESYGLNSGVGVDKFPVYMIEVTNEKSTIPLEERQSILFMLSIHGVEKGGREGGFRVMEDLLKGIGMGSETVQDGAGLPVAIPKSDGSDVQTYQDYLDFQRIFFLFPNSDGWAHDELPYAATSAPSCGSPPNGVLFCRTNGNGIDLNRQAPTMGYQNPGRNVVGEPESIGYYNWILDSGIEWDYAIDIHGMLNHENFAAIMLPAASMTPQEMQRSMRLSETLKERLNDNDHFSLWNSLMALGESVDQATLCLLVDCAQGETAAWNTVGSTTFAEYYTVWDAIGYTDSGFNGDFFAQDTGMNAPGYDIELAYNHISVDSQYEAGSLFNDYHVETVREIFKSFMDAAALDVQISFETGGKRTGYLPSSYVATNADDEVPTPGGWADQNEGDDLWDYGPDQIFTASPDKYWTDLKPFLREGDQPGVLNRLRVDQLTSSGLEGYDTFVIPGSAINELVSGTGQSNLVNEGTPNSPRIDDIKMWVENGGTLVLTDAALEFLDLAGITTEAVDFVPRYAGGITMDLSHPLLDKVRGGVRQTYEPTPLGFAVGANAAPVWSVDAGAYGALDATVAGTDYGGPGVSLGTINLGSGQIHFIGALLPDPTEEFYHPYGLDSYATTYSGNQILRNMVGWDEIFTAPPVVISEDGVVIEAANEPQANTVAQEAESESEDTPFIGIVLILGILAFLGIARRS